MWRSVLHVFPCKLLIYIFIFPIETYFLGNMGYKLVINDFHFHFHVVHTYYDYLKEFLSSFSSSLVPCFICYHINPNIPHNLLNCKPLIINIINTPIVVTQKNVHVNFQDRKHIGKNCYNVVLMLINVQNCVLHRFSKILIIYCN